MLQLIFAITSLLCVTSGQYGGGPLSPSELEAAMKVVLSTDKYTVPMKNNKIDWLKVRDQFVDHAKKLKVFEEELNKGKTEKEAAVAADLHLGYAGVKRDGSYFCYWSAKNFAETCGPKSGFGKYISYSGAKFNLKKYGIFGKGSKTISFNPACRKHDLCFSRCERSQQTCDSQFNVNLRNICNSQLTGTMSRCRNACYSVTGVFVSIVTSLGSSFYCDEVSAKNAGYFLFSPGQQLYTNVNAHCLDRVGTNIGLINSGGDMTNAVALLKMKNIRRAWVDAASCNFIQCYGRGSYVYLYVHTNGRGYLIRSSSNVKRNFLCDRNMRNGRAPVYLGVVSDLGEDKHEVVKMLRKESEISIAQIDGENMTESLNDMSHEWRGEAVFGFVIIVVVAVAIGITMERAKIDNRLEHEPLLLGTV